MSGRMEQPFYHDDSFMLGFGHADVTLHDLKVQKHVNPSESYRNLKSDLYQTSACDVSSLKLASPELERLILQNSTGVLTSPTPGQYPYGRCITDEQEGFAEGFVKALDDLHKIHQMPPPNVSIGAGDVTCASAFGSSLRSESPIYATLNAFCPTPGNPSAAVSYLPPNPHGPHPVSGHGFRNPGVHAQRFATLKEEPQTVPDMHGGDATPPVSPIDMENQERIKAERKRLRNRVAATKCRKRKLERIARLEDKVKVLKSDNAGLSNTASVLRDQVAQLKQKVLRHVNSGCQLVVSGKMEAF